MGMIWMPRMRIKPVRLTAYPDLRCLSWARATADVVATPSPRKPSQAPDTPSRRRKTTTEDPEKEDKPLRFEKVGSGRGGFSVKGAAAAAARARWAKVRREKAERGEDDDGDRKRSRTAVRRENRAAVEKLKGGNSPLPLPRVRLV